MKIGKWQRFFSIGAAFFLSGCLEASFKLSPESRLPKWFEVPNNVPRSDITITMDSYSTLSGGRYIFKMKEKDSIFNEKKIIVDYRMTKELESKERPLGFHKGYPAYEAVTVNGVTDIIEYRKMEPVFYMTDNPTIWRELERSME